MKINTILFFQINTSTISSSFPLHVYERVFIEWSPSSLEEREAVKALTIDVLLKEVDNSIRDLLAETLKIISEFEFPLR